MERVEGWAIWGDAKRMKRWRHEVRGERGNEQEAEGGNAVVKVAGSVWKREERGRKEADRKVRF